jgi:hypothetical protein
MFHEEAEHPYDDPELRVERVSFNRDSKREIFGDVQNF